MSNKKNKKTNDPKPPPGGKHVQFPDSDVRKEHRRSTKIRGSVQQTTSVESFTSAASEISLIGNDSRELIVNEEVNISVLEKYIRASLRELVPRPIVIRSCHENAKETNIASAKRLFEILKGTPACKNENINLINATLLRKLAAVKYAIRKGADVNLKIEAETPLMMATEVGDTRLVSYLLKVPQVNINTQNSLGHTPLIVAVGNGFDPIVRLLLKHNADVNLQDNMGKTPLHNALFQQRVGLVKLLLAFGADYEKSDYFGEKPMYTAAVKKPNLECLQSLLKMGAAPDYKTMSGISLLSRTILDGTDFSIIEKLVKYGASVNSQDVISRKTPLHFAALVDNLKVAEFLVDSGADVTLKTTYDYTPLDEASVQNSTEVKIFLREVMEKNNLLGPLSKVVKVRKLSKNTHVWKNLI